MAGSLRFVPSRRLLASLDANEDPISGMERVSLYTSLTDNRRCQQRADFEQLLAQQVEADRRVQDEEALSSRFESLDYEIVENELYRKEEQMPGHQRSLFRRSLNRWIVCFLIGIFTALVASIVDILIQYSSTIKFQFILKPLSKACERTGQSGTCFQHVEFAWIAYNCTLVAFAALLVLLVSPVAAGSGIPQVKCFLNGIRIPGVVRLKTLIVKSLGVAFSVGGGLSAGKEGPMIHSGAVIAAGVSQGRCVSLPIDFHIFEEFRNDRETRDFVSAGAAAGVAAAFGAPIGGVLFSLEEGASFWNQNLTWRIFFAAMISSVTLNLTLSFFYGVGGFLSWNGLANFGVFTDISYSVWEIPIFILIGILGGLSGALFNMLNLKLSRFRKRYLARKWQKFFECLLVAAVSACVGFTTLRFVDDCQPMGKNPNSNDVNRLWCPEGQYSAVADLFFQSPEESVKSLLHSPNQSFRASTLLIFAIEYYILSLWTYGLSVPSGIFIPSILTGAAWGRLVGIGVSSLFPSMGDVDPGKYALAGAASQLGGIVRMTISLTAIIVEATKDISFGLPIMLVLMIAKWVGDSFIGGLYDLHIELAEVPILGWHPPKMCRNIFAKAMMRKDVVAMEPIEKLSRIKEVLANTVHHGFPVVDQIHPSKGNEAFPDYGHLEGLILRSQLITLIAKRSLYRDPECLMAVDGFVPVVLSDFQERSARQNLNQEIIDVDSEDENFYLNLKPYMHQHPHRVPLNASLHSVYYLFRSLGLRYIAVVDECNKLRGIITRKDLARYKEKRMKNRYFIRELFVSDFHN